MNLHINLVALSRLESDEIASHVRYHTECRNLVVHKHANERLKKRSASKSPSGISCDSNVKRGRPSKVSVKCTREKDVVQKQAKCMFASCSFCVDPYSQIDVKSGD